MKLEKIVDDFYASSVEVDHIICPVCGTKTIYFSPDKLLNSIANTIAFECNNSHEFGLMFWRTDETGFIIRRYCVHKKFIRIDYREYIQSAEWKEKADAAKERAGHRCQLCNKDDNLHTHHRTYENLGNEQDGDLIVLCAKCHAKFHNKDN